MYHNPMPLAYALSAMSSPAIPDEEVVDIAPLNQGPPPGTHASKKRGVRSRLEIAKKAKRQKVGMPLPRSRDLFLWGNFLLST
jgi:hypothetical protein